MKSKQKWFKTAGLLLLIILLLAVVLVHYCQKKEIEPSDLTDRLEAQNEEMDGTLRVYFLDVGQGSAAILKTYGKYMLIDGGSAETADRLLNRLEELGVEELDYILICDYDEDHLGGLIDVMKKYEISHILSPDCQKDTETFRAYTKTAEEKEIEILHPAMGDIYSFGNTFFTIVGPTFYGHEDGRNDSLCVRLDYGDTSFLFCGDTQALGEEEMAAESIENKDISLEADVYVVNNHGGACSSSEQFLNCVRPEYAVLSCGSEEGSGFPSGEVMETLMERNVKLFRTDLQGSVAAVSDGSVIIWDVKPCSDYSWREESRGETE